MQFSYFISFKNTNFIRSAGIALLSTIFVFMLKIDIGPAASEQAPFLLFLTSIMISLWIDGLLAGILSIIFGSIVIWFFFLPPYNSFAISNWGTLLQLIVFILEGIAITFLATISKVKRENITDTIGDKKNYYWKTSLFEKVNQYIPHKSFRYFLYFFLIVYGIFNIKLFFSSVASTSFVDSLNNYVAAYFMLKGRTLYSQIFFNHQMLMAYFSFILQALTQPKTLTQLILYHRIALLLFSIIMDIFLIKRFRFTGIGFVLFYEIIKYYFFGNFFLGEAVIPYLLVYQFGLVWEKIHGRQVSGNEIIINGLLTWCISFLREPFIPITLFLYIILLWKRPFNKAQYLSVGLFFIGTIIILITVPLNDYFFQLVTVNIQNNVTPDIQRNKLYGIGILNIVFYPIFLFFGGIWNFFRFDLLGIDSIFLVLIGITIKKLRQLKAVLLILVTLALAAIRFTPPGNVLFGAFHLLPWIALLIFSIFLLLSEIYLKKELRQLADGISFSLLIIFCFLILTFRWFFTTGENIYQSFNRNYGRYYANGKVIKILAKPNSTLFVDWWDSLVYWEAGLPSSYRYTFYYPVQIGIPQFDRERMKMFYTNPPDFYYTDCEDNPVFLPGPVRYQYSQLLHNGRLGCVFVKRNLLTHITPKQMHDMTELGFSLPK